MKWCLWGVQKIEQKVKKQILLLLHSISTTPDMATHPFSYSHKSLQSGTNDRERKVDASAPRLHQTSPITASNQGKAYKGKEVDILYITCNN